MGGGYAEAAGDILVVSYALRCNTRAAHDIVCSTIPPFVPETKKKRCLALDLKEPVQQRFSPCDEGTQRCATMNQQLWASNHHSPASGGSMYLRMGLSAIPIKICGTYDLVFDLCAANLDNGMQVSCSLPT